MKSIRFVIKYDLDEPNDWSASGTDGENPPEELQDWLPHILATMLRDCVAPKRDRYEGTNTCDRCRKPSDKVEPWNELLTPQFRKLCPQCKITVTMEATGFGGDDE